MGPQSRSCCVGGVRSGRGDPAWCRWMERVCSRLNTNGRRGCSYIAIDSGNESRRRSMHIEPCVGQGRAAGMGPPFSRLSMAQTSFSSRALVFLVGAHPSWQVLMVASVGLALIAVLLVGSVLRVRTPRVGSLVAPVLPHCSWPLRRWCFRLGHRPVRQHGSLPCCPYRPVVRQDDARRGPFRAA